MPAESNRYARFRISIRPTDVSNIYLVEFGRFDNGIKLLTLGIQFKSGRLTGREAVGAVFY